MMDEGDWGRGRGVLEWPCTAGGGVGCTPPPLQTKGTGNSPVSGTAHPRSSQTGQVIRGLR